MLVQECYMARRQDVPSSSPGLGADKLSMLVGSSCCWNKTPRRSNLLKRRFVLAQSEGAVHHGRETRQQENEAAGHLHPKLGSKVGHAGTQLPLLFILSGTPARSMVPPTFRVCLPTSVNPVQLCRHRHAQRCFFWLILDRQVGSINYHTGDAK